MEKKQVAEGGLAGKEELGGGTAQAGVRPSLAAGGNRRFQMDTSRSGLQTPTYLHRVRLRAAKQEFAWSPISRSTQLLSKPKPKVLHPGPLWFFSQAQFK